MGTAAGRYTDVSRAPVPGDLPPESRRSRRLSSPPSRPRLATDPDERRRQQQEVRDLEADRLALGREPGQEARIMHGVVDDPNPCLRGRRQKAAINIKTDALEFEYARGRISEAGYWAGRTYKAVLERSRTPLSGGGAWNPGNRVDQVISHEIKILDRIARAQDAAIMIRDTAPVIGMLGQRILELVLVDELTIGAAAKLIRGRDDRQTVIFWAQQFRESCELLADFWCGPRQRAPRT